MAPDRPVASISGRRDWAWNRWQAEQHAGESSPDAAARTRGRQPPRRRREPPRRGADRRDVRELESELDRTERRLQSIVTRYERILAEKNRQLDDGTDAAPASGGIRATLLDALRRLASR